jgi:hypothetical protein
MSKARTLADFISDGSEFADGQISVAEVVGAAPLASPTFTGTVTSTGNIALGDDDELVLGSNRMRLYYSASNNYTVLDSNGTSGFVFDGVNNLSVNIGGSLSGAFTANGVSLYSGGAEKLQVYGSGTIALDDIKVNDDVKIGFGQFHTDLELYHDSATSTNKLVGDVVQTGKLTTDATDLSALAATISDTAVDIFVYDTRKDSDGGAWRKRTQNTSWYNETLNTATRGSRREFPAVAVIVAETNQVTIYDGDDPDLPMWMVFNYNSGAIYYTHAVSCVSMLNGILTIGISSTYGVSISNFVTEDIQNIRNTFGVYTYNGSIVDRNSSSGQTLNSANPLINGAVNDVAMTVLPNAPIDAATGLPVPTIAVATDGGVSVIKDDGNVYDITGHGAAPKDIGFTEDYKLIGHGYWREAIHIMDIPNSDVSIGGHYVKIYNNSTPPYTRAWRTWESLISFKNDTHAFGTDDGAEPLHVAQQSDNNGLMAYVGHDHNTGWMNGAIKLATLSDTDDTDVTGSELVTNGTFDTDTSGWTAYNDGTLSVVSGALRVTPDADGSGAQQSIATVSGKKYVLSGEFTVSGGQGRISVETSGGSTITNSGNVTSFLGGLTFTAGSATTVVKLNSNGGTSYTDFDNISVRLAEEDRSVNGNGLQVFGTVTKNPVATGADLVAYSGFGTNNFLKRPPNSDLAFGNGPFAVMGWFKGGSDTEVLCSFGSGSQIFDVRIHSNNQILTQVTDDTFATRAIISGQGPTVTSDVWKCIVIVRQNNKLSYYLNGDHVHTSSAVEANLTNDMVLHLGAENSNGAKPVTGSMALWRVSGTAPSPEQIKKIYEDEKVLFQENAQATLYGDSDAVTALAYDDSTELLHVGTSAGRSVFQGLRRVDNTTDAVGAAISASNGLVADE